MRLFAALVQRRPDLGAPRSSPAEANGIRLIGVTMRVTRDERVFSEGESADHIYKVVRGGVRGLRNHADGRRQICDFYLPGEVFGLELGARCRVAAEALTDTTLIAAPSAALQHERAEARSSRLWAIATSELHRSQAQALTLGREADVRVACFIRDMADRVGDGQHVELPMSRQDIADYLGLSIDDVCRGFTRLQASGLVALAGSRSIHLRKPGDLAEFCA